MAFANIPTNFDAGSSLRSALAEAPEQNQQLYAQGLQTGQQAATLNALAGINLNDPTGASLNQGIANLVKHGAADQASALMNLGITRQLIQSPRVQALLQGQTSQPQGQAAPSGTPAPQDAQAASQPGILDQASQDRQALIGTLDPSGQPTEATRAMAQQVRAKYVQAGVPEAAVDSELGDLSLGHLQQMQAYHSQLAQGGNAPHPLASDQYPGAPQWAANIVNDPTYHDPIFAGLLKSRLGIDTLPILQQAQSMVMPSVTQAAETAFAGPKEAAVQQAQIGALPARKGIEADLTPPVAGASPTYDVNGNHIGWHMPDGSLQAIAGAAGATAGGQAAGKAPSEIQTVNLPGGKTAQGTWAPGPNGQYVFTPVQGGAGAPAGLGTTSSTAAIESQKGDAANLNAEVAKIPARLAGYPAATAKAQAILGLADTVGTSAYTPKLQAIAQYLPGSPQKYAAQAGLLSQDLKGEFQAALGGLAVPRVAVEAKSIIGQIPSSASTPDQIKVFTAGLLAQTQYNQAHDEALQEYQRRSIADPEHYPPSLAAANAAWQAGQGRMSLFSEPAYRGLVVGGKPAVVPFTNRAGQSRLAVLPGLLKTPAIVAGP